MENPVEKCEEKASKNDKSTICDGWTPTLFAACFMSTIGTAIPVGFCLGALNTPAEFIKTWSAEVLKAHYDLHLSTSQIEVLWASIVSTFIIGGICGSFFGAWCCDKFGRKGCLLISSFLLVLSGFLFNFCRLAGSVEMLLMGRLVAGVAAALIYTAHPMYLLEIAPARLRGSVGAFTGIGVTSGIWFGQICTLHQIFGTEPEWQYGISFFAIFAVIWLLSGFWCPESPAWLYTVMQDSKSAREELKCLRGSKAEERISFEMAEMEMNSRVSVEKSSFWAVLRDPEVMLPLVLVCSFQACQQLSGINAIFYYSITIFTKAGFSVENAEWMNLGAGLLNLCITALGPIIMTKFNRRPVMMLSCVGSGISHIGMAFALNYIDLATWLPIACIVLVVSFITFFEIGMGPMPYFVGSELFEVSSRPVAMSLGSLSSWIGNLMIGMVFPLVQAKWGSFVFLPCSVVCFYGFLLTWRYLPESRGREAVDLKPLMKNGFKSKVK